MSRYLASALCRTKPWLNYQVSKLEPGGVLCPWSSWGSITGKQWRGVAAFPAEATQQHEDTTVTPPEPVETSSLPSQADPLASAPQQEADFKTKRSQENLSKFLHAAREYPGSFLLVQMLRDVVFVTNEHLKSHQAEVMQAITDMLHKTPQKVSTESKHTVSDLPEVDTTASVSGSEDNVNRDGSSGVVATLEHVPLLLSNTGRVMQRHRFLRRDILNKNRLRLRQLFKAAAAEKQFYTNPSFVSMMASAQSRLHMYTRTFWMNLHEDLLDSWNPAAVATIIHAASKVHRTHGRAEALAAAKQIAYAAKQKKLAAAQAAAQEADSSAQQVDTQHDPDTAVQTVGPGPVPTESGEPDPPAQESKPGDVRQRITPIADTNLQNFQRAAVWKFSGEMDAVGIQLCVSAFSSQGMLTGDSLELLQQGMNRTAANMAPNQVSTMISSLERSCVGLGCATDTIKEKLLKPDGIMAEMSSLKRLRALRVIHGWEWDISSVRDMCMEKFNEKAPNFSLYEAVDALALLTELNCPPDQRHKNLVELVTKHCHMLPYTAAEDALRAIEFAQTAHEESGLLYVELEDAAAALHAERTRKSKLVDSVDEVV